MQIMKLICDGMRPLRRDEPPLNDNAWELIQCCWAGKTSERPGMKDVAEWMMPIHKNNETPWSPIRVDIEGEDDSLLGYNRLDDQSTFSEETLLPKTRLPGQNMRIEEFGVKCHLSDKIVSQLNDCGYDTVGSVRLATISELKADGFKQGQINQLKHALDTWSPKNMDIEGKGDSLLGLDDQFTCFRRNSFIKNSTSWTQHED